MTIEQYIAWLRAHDACDEAVAWCEKQSDFAAGYRDCANPEWLLWLLEHAGLLDASRARLFACWCVRHTPLADGRVVWDLLTDERSRAVVEVAERYAVGKATDGELAAAKSSALSAAAYAGYAVRHATYAAWSAAGSATRDAASAALSAAPDSGAAAESATWDAWYAAGTAAGTAAWSAAWSAVATATRDAARTATGTAASAAKYAAEIAQCARIREVWPVEEVVAAIARADA